jgi:hypothetical protein
MRYINFHEPSGPAGANPLWRYEVQLRIVNWLDMYPHIDWLDYQLGLLEESAMHDRESGLVVVHFLIQTGAAALIPYI